MKKLTLVFALALTVSCASAPALTSANPTEAEAAKVRLAAVRIADSVTAGLTIVDEIGKLANQLPIPTATKDSIDCAIIKVTGLSVPPSPKITEVCGPVPNGPGPLPYALGQLQGATAEPSLRATVTTILGALDPLLAKLEAANQPALKALAVSLRATFAYARLFLGGRP